MQKSKIDAVKGRTVFWGVGVTARSWAAPTTFVLFDRGYSEGEQSLVEGFLPPRVLPGICACRNPLVIQGQSSILCRMQSYLTALQLPRLRHTVVPFGAA